MGVGHIYRSLALADMIKDDFHTTFVVRSPLKSLRTNILNTCNEIIELDENVSPLEESKFLSDTYLSKSDIVVFDGYHFTTEYQKEVKQKECHLLSIDDIYDCQFLSDVIINHAPGIEKKLYEGENYTQYCLGFPYALLRKPFLEAARKEKGLNKNEEQNLFISLGGADPKNDIQKVLETYVTKMDVTKSYIVIGAAYQHGVSLRAYLEDSNLEYELLQDLGPEDMVFYMEKCSRAITAPSTVSLEYLCTGGNLFLHKIADNQNYIYNYMTSNGIAAPVHQILHSKTSKNDVKYIDGKQEMRYKRLFNSFTLDVKVATNEDLMLYYDWANEEEVRNQSYNKEKISLADHTNWFTKRLNSESSELLILVKDDASIGQVRFEVKENIATINYSIDKDARGKGYGEAVIRRAMLYLLKNRKDVAEVIGYVKGSNIGSLKTFRAINFMESNAMEFPNSKKFTLKI